MSDKGLDGLFADHSVLAILRGMPVRTTVELAERAWDLGVTAIEVPARDARGLEALHATVRAGAERGHPVGAGTVITPDQVRAVSEAGAAFTVAPGFDAEVMGLSEAAGMPHLPGVATPTDIQKVLRAGGHWVKAFPATSLGTDWFRAMAGPFPDVRIVATGGMDARNARQYLDAGARMVAVGSALTDPEQIPLLAALV
ncbi:MULTISPECIES: bifunctional 4-hydroxy-2-oxoglutarate aldolase/2-dehydro-3-deoxy-phosphogluconate aldolase [Nocardiopsis]|uniref:bifunctional 4-hydroxy-2-oxoglutarate aldolase/2-dehydro-3-deoxy-phosphogluconate aldolase n=1 Tax=Nocardiopsis TaxID=2013 RepID=UPI00034B7352|nr:MULTISPECIES: bifunctional 4-hydroxy-2-oxoglutarate aldolase/2-dehydro-3-deoxy-phosphogluconate aldolase [Nocardiopsis]PWV47318.1 2-keto-3-deoxy-phosphogluconate aldolase [Nocardiopsis sp. L17-MgMaSL7]